MKIITLFNLLAAGAGSTAATNIFVSSYSGAISSLSLSHTNGSYALSQVYSHLGCAPSPSWLTLDKGHDTLYCLNEGISTPNGSISSFRVLKNGTLLQNVNISTIAGPVHGSVYGGQNSSQALALAHYSKGAVSTFGLNGTLTRLQNITFSLAAPGPDKARQSTSHAHQVILDPTGRFLLVPDLGADLIHIFSFNPHTLLLTAQVPLQVQPGSGPRHATFSHHSQDAFNQSQPLYLYVVTELTNTLTSYAVVYPAAGGLAFNEVFHTNTFGGSPAPVGAAAAEIALSPVDSHILISNRNDGTFRLPDMNPANATAQATDSIASYTLRPNGTLDFTQLWPAGGSFPRSFAMNNAGTLVAVALQMSSRLVVLARNPGTALLWNEVAAIEVDGELTSVVWG